MNPNLCRSVRRCTIVTVLMLALAGCQTPDRSSSAIELPEGDPVLGRNVFLDQRCVNCHEIAGENLEPDWEYIPRRIELTSRLSGQPRGQIINSIINPKHATRPTYEWETMPPEEVFSMINYSEAITLRQLSDVEAFLRSRVSEK